MIMSKQKLIHIYFEGYLLWTHLTYGNGQNLKAPGET